MNETIVAEITEKVENKIKKEDIDQNKLEEKYIKLARKRIKKYILKQWKK